MNADNNSTNHFKRLIKSSYNFREISLEIKKILIENNTIDESTTYENLIGNATLVETLKRKFLLGLSDQISESQYGKPFVDDFSLYYNLKNAADIQNHCDKQGLLHIF